MNPLPPADDVDLALLDVLQDDLPVTSRPWQGIADRLGIPEDEVIVRLEHLTDAGIIRGISPVLESWPLGLHAATLVALRVGETRIDEVAGIISTYKEVSHNFRRDHEYNLWFTIAAPDPDGLRKILGDILHRTGIRATDVLNLPTRKKIKIDVRFSFSPAHPTEHCHGPD